MRAILTGWARPGLTLKARARLGLEIYGLVPPLAKMISEQLLLFNYIRSEVDIEHMVDVLLQQSNKTSRTTSGEVNQAFPEQNAKCQQLRLG